LNEPRFSRFGDFALRIAIAIALLIPCFWQTRIHAGDLSSHVYNAWLAGQIKSGAVQGMTIVPMWTNVLTDWALERLLVPVGPAAAQRIVVASAVLVFYWGAFFLLQVTSGRRPWMFCPILAVLSYGLVFHFGFLNFYFSTGLSFWILGLLWRPSWVRAYLAVALIALAILAHALPVAWALSVLAYLHIVRALHGRWKLAMPVIGLGGLVLIQWIVHSRFPHRWSSDPAEFTANLAGILGLDQVWLYDAKYLIVAGVLFLLWIALFLKRLEQGGFLTDPKVQIWLMHVAAFVLMPSAIQFPGYQRPLAYILQRISLLTAIAFCILASNARYERGIKSLSVVAAAMFFAFLNLDDRGFNRAEDEVTQLVAALPLGQRVVAAVDDSGARLDALIHVADRACIGRCFSYGDYEPAMGQFRIRVLSPNRVVASNMAEVLEIEEGRHTVTPAEAPLYSVCDCEKDGNRFCLRALHAGERTCAVSVPISWRLWSSSELTRQNERQVPDH
jgi:hypothetical protein